MPWLLRRSNSRTRPFLAAALLAAALAPEAACADTVASLLGNFTTNQFVKLELGPGSLRVRYAIVLGQLPALRELHAADTDRDGVTTASERTAYARSQAAAAAEALVVTVDGMRVPLQVLRSGASLPAEQAGFSLRVDAEYAGTLPAARERHELAFANRNFDGRFGWQEIVVEPSPGLAVFATDAHADSLTAGLTEAVQALPPEGPLAEREVRLSYREGPLRAGESGPKMRAGESGSRMRANETGSGIRANESASKTRAGVAGGPDAGVADHSPPDNGGSSFVQRATRDIVDLVAGPALAPHVALLAFAAALLLGALHAFSPGHGKAIVGAYLIGSRATARHAAFLGLTVTVTHTLGVFALGFATLAASAYVVPETLLPILGVASGAIIVAMGATLTWQRWPAVREAWQRRARTRAGTPAFRALVSARPAGGAPPGHVLAALHGGFVHAHARGGSPEPDLAVSRTRAGSSLGAGWHSHGGRWHTHLPPGTAGEDVTWRSLLALGISGGLVPCPSAMVLMLAAIALGKTALGLGLVVAFSAGLALALTAVGLVFLYAGHRLTRAARTPAWLRVLPFASAIAVLLLGMAVAWSALP